MLKVITGPMFSGKSVELIRQVNRYKIAGKRVMVFKYSADTRYSVTEAASYDGLTTWAIPVSTAADIEARVTPEHEVVVIDEVQFFDAAVVDLIFSYVRRGMDVVVGGLNLDFRGEPFSLSGGTKNMGDILVRADSIHLLHAICTARVNGRICGEEATRTQRLTDGEPSRADEPLVQIGSTESYEARCIAHHYI